MADMTILNTRIEFEGSEGLGRYVVTAPGVRLEAEYTDPDAMVAVIYGLPDILGDANDAWERGDVEELPPRERDWEIPE